MPDSPLNTLSVEEWSDPSIRIIRLSRPDSRNALSVDVIRRLEAALARINADEHVVCTVITGGAEMFCSGLDLVEVKAGKANELTEAMGRLVQRLRSMSAPVISLVAGPCTAGGLLIPLCSDLVVAWRNAQFAAPEIKLGLVPAILTWAARGRMSMSAVRAHWLTGEPFGADDALRYGLVHQVLDDGQPLAGAIETCVAPFAGLDPATLRSTKEILAANEWPSREPKRDLVHAMQCSKDQFSARGSSRVRS